MICKSDSLKAFSLAALLSLLPGCGSAAEPATPAATQPVAPPAAQTGTHLDGSTLYPRLIRLWHAPAPLTGTILAKTGNKLFRSLDEGHTFTFLTTVPTVSLEAGNPTPAPNAPDIERCCSTIFELPQAIGPMSAGTLLYAGSFFSGGIPAIELYTSSDEGVTWRYVATPMRAGDDHHGLWEPEFTVAHDGTLVMFVSDETDPCCSQKLISMRTRDGLHWTPKQDLVASTTQTERPGMAIVSILPGGTYFMTYEICGPIRHCQVYSRTSPDGLNYGDPADPGAKLVSTTGQYLAHTPANVYLASAGQLLVISQMVYEKDGSVSPQNGKLIFLQKLSSSAVQKPAMGASNPGAGTWLTRPAPVEVPGAYDNYCPNYSSALLLVRSGLLELASAYDASNQCTSYFAILPM